MQKGLTLLELLAGVAVVTIGLSLFASVLGGLPFYKGCGKLLDEELPVYSTENKESYTIDGKEFKRNSRGFYVYKSKDGELMGIAASSTIQYMFAKRIGTSKNIEAVRHNLEVKRCLNNR